MAFEGSGFDSSISYHLFTSHYPWAYGGSYTVNPSNFNNYNYVATGYKVITIENDSITIPGFSGTIYTVVPITSGGGGSAASDSNAEPIIVSTEGTKLMRALVAPRIVAGAHVLGENETEVETGDGVYVRYNSATRELMIFA